MEGLLAAPEMGVKTSDVMVGSRDQYSFEAVQQWHAVRVDDETLAPEALCGFPWSIAPDREWDTVMLVSRCRRCQQAAPA